MDSISLIKKIMSLGIALIITGFIYTSINNANAGQECANATEVVNAGGVEFKVMDSTCMELSVTGNTWRFAVDFDITMKFADKVKIKFDEVCEIYATDEVAITVNMLPQFSIDVPAQAGHGCGWSAGFAIKENGNWSDFFDPNDFMHGSKYFGVALVMEMIPKSGTKAEIKLKGNAHVGPSHSALQFKKSLTVFHKTLNL